MCTLIALFPALAAAAEDVTVPAVAAAGGCPVLSWAPAAADSYNYGTLTAGQTAEPAAPMRRSPSRRPVTTLTR